MFRFSIRDVLWLTVVVGMLAARWVERSAAVKQQAENNAAISSLRQQNVDLESRNAKILKAIYFQGLTVKDTGSRIELKQRRDARGVQTIID